MGRWQGLSHGYQTRRRPRPEERPKTRVHHHLKTGEGKTENKAGQVEGCEFTNEGNDLNLKVEMKDGRWQGLSHGC